MKDPLTKRQRRLRLIRIDSGASDSQDKKDMAHAALWFAPVMRRCCACLRMTLSGYVCVHCNDYNGGDFPPVSKQMEAMLKEDMS